MPGDLLLRPDHSVTLLRFKVIHEPTGQEIGAIARSHTSQLSDSYWHWSINHPFEVARVGIGSGNARDRHEAMEKLASYWREAPVPSGMHEYEGFYFDVFKPPRDIPWTAKITRRDAQPFVIPDRPAKAAPIHWMRLSAAKNAIEAVLATRRAIGAGDVYVVK